MRSLFRRIRGPSPPFALALALACGPADAPETEVAAAPPTELPLSGHYRVSGVTVDRATGAERKVSGSVILTAEGDRYRSSFHLTTTLMGGGMPQKAELVGQGEGRVDGRHLSGSAETQLIVALVPGVDAGFGLMPRAATARIVNRSEATIAADGSVHIEIQSEPAAGEDYSPTRTTLRGRRIAAVGIGGENP